MAKRINRKTGQEEPLRNKAQILNEIKDRLWRRIRHGAPAIQNEEMILVYEALEYLMDWDDETDFTEVTSGDAEASGTGQPVDKRDPGAGSE